MSNTTDLINESAIAKLKSLAEEINMCLFCTNLRRDDGSTARPMSVQKVDDEGCLWFFSEADSEKNIEIKENKKVQLFFSHPGTSSFMVVNGDAEILFDAQKIEELWNPLLKTWFPEGKDDPNLSILKVQATSAYYWDTDGNRMINFFKMLASAATGTNLVTGNEGSLSI